MIGIIPKNIGAFDPRLVHDLIHDNTDQWWIKVVRFSRNLSTLLYHIWSSGVSFIIGPDFKFEQWLVHHDKTTVLLTNFDQKKILYNLNLVHP